MELKNMAKVPYYIINDKVFVLRLLCDLRMSFKYNA